jgi:uncharacterized protein (DUF427 family)
MKKIEPGPGEESVWDYPRPPRVESVEKTVQVVFNGKVIAESSHSKRVLETSHPPVYYIPREDIKMNFLKEAPGTSYCEWKGRAEYFHVQVEESTAEKAAWCYPEPTGKFEEIRNDIAFYAEAMDACYVGDEKVKPQEGNFYGGWITSNIVGPFKGGAGTMGW